MPEMKVAFSNRAVRQYANYRFYFQIAGDTYQILDIIGHPK